MSREVTLLEQSPHNRIEMEPESKILEEHLREAACIGDHDAVMELIRTALHWAARRNHKKIVELLMRNGASPQIQNKKGASPGNVSSDNEIQTVLGTTGPASSPQLPITPSYLRYPSLPVSKNLKLAREISTSKVAIDPNENLVLKVRIADMDPDFVEVELNRAGLTVEELIKVCCRELELDSGKVKKIRKLQNTVIRKGRDVERLSDCQETELCL